MVLAVDSWGLKIYREGERKMRILGGHLASRKFENQVNDARIRALVLNKMTSLGMPQSYPVAL